MIQKNMMRSASAGLSKGAMVALCALVWASSPAHAVTDIQSNSTMQTRGLDVDRTVYLTLKREF